MESNKLIAEFMGFPKQQDAVDDRTIAYYIGDVIKADNRHNENEDDVFHPDDMQFHKSWDWLMPVVHKCFEVSSFKIEGDMKGLVLWLQIADIKGTYRTIVEFITVYNRENGNNND